MWPIILFYIIIHSSLVGEIEKRVGELWVEINADGFGFFFLHSCLLLKRYKFVSVPEMYVSVCVCLIVDVGAIGIKYNINA